VEVDGSPDRVIAADGSGAEQELKDGLVQLSFAVMTILNRVGAQHELSMTQLRVLGILTDRQPKMMELAEYLGLDKSSISGLIDRGVKRGLVERVSSPEDGRSTRVSLTTEGRQLARTAGAEISRSVAELVQHLPPADRRRLSVLLTRVGTAEGMGDKVN
jgi:MarR family transcriptional regulator, lower aerobic nicotinate degradation pathway regulator